MDSVFYSTGRRKESTARVFLSKGTGKITVNSNPIEKYFGRQHLINGRKVTPLKYVNDTRIYKCFIKNHKLSFTSPEPKKVLVYCETCNFEISCQLKG